MSTVSADPSTQFVMREKGETREGKPHFPRISFRLDFAWQEAYAAFTVGIAQIDETLAYIENQAVHHARRDYRAELIAFLRRHNIEFEEKYLQD